MIKKEMKMDSSTWSMRLTNSLDENDKYKLLCTFTNCLHMHRSCTLAGVDKIFFVHSFCYVPQRMYCIYTHPEYYFGSNYDVLLSFL